MKFPPQKQETRQPKQANYEHHLQISPFAVECWHQMEELQAFFCLFLRHSGSFRVLFVSDTYAWHTSIKRS